MNISHLDFEYLRPPRQVFDVIHKGDYVLQTVGNRYTRRIFHDVHYTKHETDKLAEFQLSIEKANIALPADWTNEDLLRYAYSGKLALKKSLNILKAHLAWRLSLSDSVLSDKSIQMLNEGVVYVAGRDLQYRPIIVINLTKIEHVGQGLEDFINTLCFLLSVVKEYYFVPGKVENWIICVDTNGAGLLKFPLKVFKRIVEVTSTNFTCMLEKLYILNPSPMLKSAWGFIQGMLDPVTKGKVVLLKKSKYSQLLNEITPGQLEKRFGGTLPDMEVFWPPVNTLNKPPYTQSKRTYEDTTGIKESSDITDGSKNQPTHDAWVTTMDNVADKQAKMDKDQKEGKSIDYNAKNINTIMSHKTEFFEDLEDADEEVEEREIWTRDAQRPMVSVFQNIRRLTQHLSTIREETFEEGGTSIMYDGQTLRGLSRNKSAKSKYSLKSTILSRKASTRHYGSSPTGVHRGRTTGRKGSDSISYDLTEGGPREVGFEGRSVTPVCCRWPGNEETRGYQSESCNIF